MNWNPYGEAHKKMEAIEIKGHPRKELFKLITHSGFPHQAHFERATLTTLLVAGLRYHGLDPLTWLNKYHYHSRYLLDWCTCILAFQEERLISVGIENQSPSNTIFDPHHKSTQTGGHIITHADFEIIENNELHFTATVRSIAGVKACIEQIHNNYL